MTLRTCLAFAAFGLLLAQPTLATPTTTAVEGTLQAAAGGGPAADGNYSATFALYPSEKGGSPVWSEGPVTLALVGGHFAVVLGTKAPIDAEALAKSPALWLGMQIGSDPELPRSGFHSVVFALHAAVADKLACSGCIDTAHFAPNALKAYAKQTDLDAFATWTALAAYAKTAELANYAKATDLGNYAKAADLANYVKAQSLATVAASGSYSDLKNVPAVAKLGAACGTGLLVKGLKADGSLDCAGFGTIAAKDMPADGLDEVSNGVLSTQFDEVTASASLPKDIPDGLGAGISDAMVVADFGTAEEITIKLGFTNSDVSKVRVDVYDPLGNKATLYNGEASGTKLAFSVSSATNAFLQAWLGKNAKGNWSVVVADLAKGSASPDGKLESWSVTIRVNHNKKAQVLGDLVVNGAITGNAAQLLVPKGAVMAFNLSTCPVGWSELTAARGRTIVGMPGGGSLGATVGTALTDKENRPVGKHGHGVSDPGHSHGFLIDSDTGYDGGSGAPAGEDNGVYNVNTKAASTGISVADSGSVDGTNSPYLQLLYCTKN